MARKGITNTLLSAEGIVIDWPYPCAPTSSLPADTLRALIDPDPITRCIAAADIPGIKAQQIYKGPSYSTFEQYKACGRKLREFDCVELARGLDKCSSELAKIICGAKSKKELRERLVAAFF